MLRELEAALEPVRKSLSATGWKKIREAWALYHRTQKKDARTPIGLEIPDHGLEVLQIASRMHLDADSLGAALLASAYERGCFTLEEVKTTVGEEIGFLCETLRSLPTFRFPGHAQAERMGEAQLADQAESFRKMLFSMARDLRVLLIRLCDRLYALRGLEFVPVSQQLQIAHECRELYAPLANRLGISWLKNELEDLSLRYLHPLAFYDLVDKIDQTKRERERYIDEVLGILRFLTDKQQLRCEVYGRSKHINSIYRKMTRGGLTFEQLYDVLAFRILCDTRDQCYQILGVVHDRWKPIPGRFKDYIAMSKNNGYQSLHTTVLGPGNKKIEIQIRTHAMHKTAEDGVAAHWLYKEGSDPQARVVEQFRWLRELLRLQDEKEDASELLASVRDKLHEGDVFVFTPNGAVRELPQGSTPVDFAYAIHTEVGNHCVGAKVNGKIVPLRAVLNTGDIVEILTQPNSNPNRDWLKFVKTNRARSKIRSFLRTEQREKASVLGREMLDKALPAGQKVSKLLKNGSLEPLCSQVGAATVEELIMNIGYGKLDVTEVVNLLFPPEKPETVAIEDVIKRPSASKGKTTILVGGMRDILVRFAGCCKPIPGDPIVGFISRGRGAVIHSADCSKVQSSDPARRIDVQWDASPKSAHSVKIRVLADNRPGLLNLMTKAFSDLNINISSAQCTTSDTLAVNIFECQVRDIEQLQHLLQRLSRVKGVSQAKRVRE
ncbi:MAG: bifunctional (p)ppGpp synthetase/guanosine-3',5'-bis(diphosphate) 3'-pyrophosphohydrolase [Myxococcales bacterium]|nr:bifunctional (p)ppGpp synthetase/guanosine-3',5'-bis(diphosphate) 3'-pyrophosphohydrolase [Myxococcales bacterium]MCB9641904.1 bifunctional (p)ppGpp synthetase/guanosine-3',5'-bis(diphosphate) 3'-pyrophosphohydrolase [Myxococcales bacterium]